MALIKHTHVRTVEHDIHNSIANIQTYHSNVFDNNVE